MKIYEIYAPDGKPIKVIQGHHIDYDSRTFQTFIRDSSDHILAAVPTNFLIIIR